MRTKLLALAAAALGLCVSVATPAMALDSEEVREAYLEGKRDSLIGEASMRDDIRCLALYNLWADLLTKYDSNLGKTHGELGYGYIQLQYHHYAVRMQALHMGDMAKWRATLESVAREIGSMKVKKDREVKNVVRKIGRCAVPVKQLSLSDNKPVRAEHFFLAIGSQPFEQSYPDFIRDRSRWDGFADAMLTGQLLKAAQIGLESLEAGDGETIHEREYVAVIDALVALGLDGNLPQRAFARAAFVDPDRYARRAGLDPADFRKRIESITASATSGLAQSSLAAGNQASGQAERMARERCRNAGGRTLRVSSRPVDSFKATDTTYRATYQATAQCEFAPAISGG